MTLAPVLLLALLVVAGCTGSGSADPTTAASPSTAATAATATTTATTTTTTTTATSTTTSSRRPTSSGSSAASTVHTDGGDVTVRARAGALEVVEVTAADGWTGEQRLDDATHLVVSFDRKGARVEVSVELTPSGIRTATRSIASS